jgi:hypothetical protein
MRAKVGHRVVVETHHVGRARREGEIIEIISGHVGDHYRVQWESGAVSILFPDSDCMIWDTRTEQLITGSDRRSGIDLRSDEEQAPSFHAEMDLWFDEDDTHTEARATIHLREYELTGFGRAQRHPHDPNLPAVGEELSAARALSDLAHQLLDLATYQLEKREGRSIHVDL